MHETPKNIVPVEKEDKPFAISSGFYQDLQVVLFFSTNQKAMLDGSSTVPDRREDKELTTHEGFPGCWRQPKRKNTFFPFGFVLDRAPGGMNKVFGCPFFQKGAVFALAMRSMARRSRRASQSAFVLTHLSKLRKRSFAKGTKHW